MVAVIENAKLNIPDADVFRFGSDQDEQDPFFAVQERINAIAEIHVERHGRHEEVELYVPGGHMMLLVGAVNIPTEVYGDKQDGRRVGAWLATLTRAVRVHCEWGHAWAVSYSVEEKD